MIESAASASRVAALSRLGFYMSKSIKLALATMFATLLFPCAMAADIGLVLGEDFEAEEEHQQAFLSYGLALIKWHQDNPRSKPPYKFDREYSAHETMIKIWIELREKGSVPDSAYMSEMRGVYEAGYLREYVWHFHRHEKWRKPRRLDMGEFGTYLEQHLPNHNAKDLSTVVRVKI